MPLAFCFSGALGLHMHNTLRGLLAALAGLAAVSKLMSLVDLGALALPLNYEHHNLTCQSISIYCSNQ